ncbi:hypothetical protein [Pseudomonas sp. ATCC 13867]|uniref:hypothetical protein n=1 Tax=Pseudomonas sp. ATCC 13867 TaxID=1294143 RepID=UPI001F2E3DE8|nr:hypothetical protein [uncultured Pseudomonas sp.]
MTIPSPMPRSSPELYRAWQALRAALLRQNPGLAATRAVRGGRVASLDATLLVDAPGPRIPEGLASLSRASYPSAQALNSESRP